MNGWIFVALLVGIWIACAAVQIKRDQNTKRFKLARLAKEIESTERILDESKKSTNPAAAANVATRLSELRTEKAKLS